VDRFAFAIGTLAEAENCPPLALYFDNLESLMKRPDHDDYVPEATAPWRAETRQLWTVLARLAEQHPGRLAGLASSRYRNPDFRWDDILGFPRLTDDEVFRMLEWFPNLGSLTGETRARLAQQLAGHGRAVEFLDGLVCHQFEEWFEHHETLPADHTTEWVNFITPVLAATKQQLRDDLLFDALWHKALRPQDRRLLVRLTVLRRPADREIVLALADPADKEQDFRRLREYGLLEQNVDPEDPNHQRLLFDVHPSLTSFAQSLAPDWEQDRTEAARLAGSFLEQRYRSGVGVDAADVFDASHYLLAGGEYDRGYDCLTDLAQWFLGRGQVSRAYLALMALLPDSVRSKLSPRNQAVVFGQLGDVQRAQGDLAGGAGQLPQGLGDCRAAGPAGQDPGNADWQRDLSYSHTIIAQLYEQQGHRSKALPHAEATLAIDERLAALDRSNVTWQKDVQVSRALVARLRRK
jgi:hypothetical protein